MGSFKEDMRDFMQRGSSSREETKKKYLELAKKYHPDKANEAEKDLRHQCMILLNKAYAALLRQDGTGKGIDGHDQPGEYGKYLRDGKYEFKNRYDVLAREKDLIVFVYKLGLNGLLKAQDLLVENSIMAIGKNEKVIEEATGLLYESYRHFSFIIQRGTGDNWEREARQKMKWAFEINGRITQRNLGGTGGEIVIS
jgi:hypothetical protein